MNRYAILNRLAGVVVNVVEDRAPPADSVMVDGILVSPGDLYDGNKFTRPRKPPNNWPKKKLQQTLQWHGSIQSLRLWSA